MKLVNRKSLGLVILLSLTSIVTTACGDDSPGSRSIDEVVKEPLGPEELGYYRELYDDWDDTVDYAEDYVEHTAAKLQALERLEATDKSDEEAIDKNRRALNNASRKLRNSFFDLESDSEENISLLSAVDPPASMENFHAEWLNLLEATAASGDPNSDTLFAQANEFIRAHTVFDDEFGDRPKDLSENGPMSLQFQPLGLPVTASSDLHTGKLGLELSFSEIATPWGVFSLAGTTSTNTDVTDLIVLHKESVKYVALTPNSEIFVDSTCGVSLRYPKEGRLVLDVKECGDQPPIAGNEPNNVPRPSTNTSPFPVSSFPRNSCGDVLPSESSAYPLKMYPVYIEYNDQNLSVVKRDYCADALQRRRQSTGEQVIQVASFIGREKAELFQAVLEDDFDDVEIGEATDITESPVVSSESTESTRPSTNTSPFPVSSFPRNSCGDVLPSESSAYPLKMYPVYIEYNDQNLSVVKRDYCADALQRRRQSTGEQAIQVASFIGRERAELFQAVLEDDFDDVEIGEATDITKSPE